MSDSVYEAIQRRKIIAICRRIYGRDLLELTDALLTGGVCMIEVTFDQSDKECIKTTPSAIRSIIEHTDGEVLAGAGTVLSVDQVKAAAQAGAKYIISPNTDKAVIEHTKELGLISIPGAMTPSEILTAYNYGADFVKLFPAGTLGFKYIKDILAPITHIPLIATGGVKEEILPEYLQLGFAGAGVSGRLCDKKLISEKNYKEITSRAKAFMNIVNEYKH